MDNFTRAKMPYTNFLQTRRIIASFDYADLSMSTFLHANLKNARFYENNLTTVNFSHANLQKTEFLQTRIEDSQLRSALSIRDARLPDGSLGKDPNLVKNGEADCNSSPRDSWKLQIGEIVTKVSDTNSSNCYYTLQSYDVGAVMLQRINLSNIWNYQLWPYSHAVFNATMGNTISIQLVAMNNSGTVLAQQNSSKLMYPENHLIKFFSLQ